MFMLKSVNIETSNLFRFSRQESSFDLKMLAGIETLSILLSVETVARNPSKYIVDGWSVIHTNDERGVHRLNL